MSLSRPKQTETIVFEKMYSFAKDSLTKKQELSTAIFKEICQLAVQANDKAALEKLIAPLGNDLCYWVVMMLAWQGHTESANWLIKNFNVDAGLGAVIQGYAWAERLELLDNIEDKRGFAVRGFGLGKHTVQVNRLIEEEKEAKIEEMDENNFIVLCATEGYVDGGHVENLQDTLELIVLTPEQSLKVCLAKALKKKLDTIDVEELLGRAEKIVVLSQELKIDYPSALAILTDNENNGLVKEPNNLSTPIQQSILFFKDVVSEKLSFYQRKAIEESKQCGLTENVMYLYWKKPTEMRDDFTLGHQQCLNYLINDRKISVIDAIQEINYLNFYQVCALKELYLSGLRGNHLREWTSKVKLIFTDKHFEALTKMVAKEGIELNTALGQIIVNNKRSFSKN